MKNLTKIFMAVAAGMLAFSCVTDVTEDLAPELGLGEELTTITLSLEESRTYLGKKVGELYPLYWSEGDKISVNGVESGEAVIKADKPESATFEVKASSPYCIAYPAAPAGQVLFAVKQNHVAAGDTFESGVTTMYAYSKSSDGGQLNHLTGVLKFGITGSATLEKLQISTANRDQIAGYFDFDFENGELKKTAGAKSVIEYSFGEGGLQLSETAQYVHIAVPAGLNDGLYDELYVTLYEKGNSGNIMYATIKADSEKPLTVGDVREFNNPIPYAPNAQLFVINSVAKLKEFKTAVESAEGLAKDAIITEDIDMTEVADWSPINGENYVNTLIGNGYAIKGLKAPLFENTSASFKGVHLEDVAISTNDAPVMGALACTITATDAVSPKVEHCSVSGTFTVNNPNYTVVTNNDPTEMHYGALVARVYGTSIEDCTNYATVTVSQIASTSNELTTRPNIAGVVAYCDIFGTRVSNVTNCVNNGDVTYADTVCDGSHARGSIAGVVALSPSTHIGATFDGLVNNGTITINANMMASDVFIGGCISIAYGNPAATYIKNSTNNGAISINGEYSVPVVHIGGVSAFLEGVQSDTIVNNGAITVGSESNYMDELKNLYIGGFSGKSCDKGDVDARVSNVTNNAPITVWANGTACSALRIGGLLSWSQDSGSNNKNTEKGKITVRGTYTLTSDATNTYAVGGLVGYKTSNSFSGCENKGDIDIDVTYTSTKAMYIFVGGLAGRSHQNIKGTNYGDIAIKGSSSAVTTSGSRTYVGGVFGWANGSSADMTNSGNVTIDGEHMYFITGGALGHAYNGTISEINNYGNVEMTGTYYNTNLGGVIGWGGNTDDGKSVTMTDCVNEGNIEFAATSTQNCTISGVVASGSTTLNGVRNGALGADGKPANDKGKISFTGTMSEARLDGNAGTLYIAGIMAGQTKTNRTDCVNYGDILIDGAGDSSQRNIYNLFGGGMTYNSVGATYTNCHNYGDITVTEKTNVTNSIRLGGMIANVDNKPTKNVVGEDGNVVKDENGKTVTEPNPYTIVFDGCSNSGSIVIKGRSATRGAGTLTLSGGIASFSGYCNLEVRNGYTNSGDIRYEGSQENTNTDTILLAGFIASADKDNYTVKFDGDIINRGKIAFTGKAENNGGLLQVGGLLGYYRKLTPMEHTNGTLINTGDIELSGTFKARYNLPRVAGIAAYPESTNITNAQSFCNIKAVIPSTMKENIGWILAIPRTDTNTTQWCKNCKIGTRPVEVYDDEEEDWKPGEPLFNGSNFHQYIYGLNGLETPNWAGTEDYDGCTWLEKESDIVYATPAVTNN